MNKEDTLKQICKMIASGEIPDEVYNKYLSKTPIGFMSKTDLYNFLKDKNNKISDLEDNWEKIKEYIRKNIIYNNAGMKILDPSPLEDYIQELEGSDNNE